MLVFIIVYYKNIKYIRSKEVQYLFIITGLMAYKKDIHQYLKKIFFNRKEGEFLIYTIFQL